MTREFKTSIGPKARRAEEARLSRLCRSIHKHKEVREAVERLRAGLPDLIANVIRWLGSYGVSFDDADSAGL